MMKYRKKPIVIGALQWLGHNKAEMAEFMAADLFVEPVAGSFDIGTLEGTMTAYPGDWIICGVNGEYYPCKPDIFAKTYEPA